jgi:cytoskeletal protein CcmA (bactofilin family)
MGFFKDFKDDLSDAVNEIVSDETQDEKAESTQTVSQEVQESVQTMQPVYEPDATRFNEETEVAVITKGLKIKGDIECVGAVEIYGQVEGSIVCDGKLVICGSVTGNSETKEFFANKANIRGDVLSHGSAKVGQGTKLIGNVSAQGMVVAGAIKGNIDVQGPVILDSTAVVMGDIRSKSIQINNGAIIDGHFSQCYAETSAAAFFEENE